MHVHLHVHRWVIWWLWFGVLCGLVASVNLLTHTLTREQEDVIVFLGVLYWALGGVVCWALDGARYQKPDRTPPQSDQKNALADWESEGGATLKERHP